MQVSINCARLPRGQQLGRRTQRRGAVLRASADQRQRGPSGLNIDGYSPTSPRGWDTMRSALLAAGVKLLSPQELLWAAEKGALVVDVRPEADYDTGHIPGAASVPFYRPITGWSAFKIARRVGYALFGVLNGTEVNESFAADVQELLQQQQLKQQQQQQVILYCSQGGVLESTDTYKRGWQTRSLVAAHELLRGGVAADIMVMRGGYSEWIAGGRDIEIMELVGGDEDDGAATMSGGSSSRDAAA